MQDEVVWWVLGPETVLGFGICVLGLNWEGGGRGFDVQDEVVWWVLGLEICDTAELTSHTQKPPSCGDKDTRP